MAEGFVRSSLYWIPVHENDFYCVNKCPEKAISLRLNPSFEVLGDRRWPAELLAYLAYG